MFRARGKLRLEIEEALANAEKLKEEAEIILLKESDLSAKNAKLLKELEVVRKELAEQEQKTQQRREQGNPLRLEVEQARSDLQEIEEQNKKVINIGTVLSVSSTLLAVFQFLQAFKKA